MPVPRPLWYALLPLVCPPPPSMPRCVVVTPGIRRPYARCHYLSGTTLPQAPSGAVGAVHPGLRVASELFEHGRIHLRVFRIVLRPQRPTQSTRPIAAYRALPVGSNHVWQTGPCAHRWLGFAPCFKRHGANVGCPAVSSRSAHGHNRSSFRTKKVPFRCGEPSLDVAPDPIRHHLHC